MRYKLLGRTGLRVSELCLGAMIFGDQRGPWGATPEDARQIFTAYAEADGNFIDTANTYSQGNSERIVGAVALAYGNTFDRSPYEGRGSRQRLVMGRRRSRPKFFWLIFGPGGYCRRLYSAASTSRTTRSTRSGSCPAAISSAVPMSFST